MSPQQTENDELRGRFTVWITKTARNAQINYLHKESRQLKTIPLETTEVQLIASEQDALEQTVSVANGFEFMESRLADAFRELPLMRRRILEMLFVEELSPAEIAAKLHCTVQHVYNQRSLAIKRLRQQMMKERGQNDEQ